MLLNFPKKRLKKDRCLSTAQSTRDRCHKTEHFLNKLPTQLSGSLQNLQINFPTLTCICTFQTASCDLRKHSYSQNNAVVTLQADSNEKEDTHSQGQPSWPQHSYSYCVTLFSPLQYDLNSFLSFLCGGVMIQTHNKKASCQTKQMTQYFSFLGWTSPPLYRQGLC